MTTKTLRVTLADALGPAGPAGRVKGEVWARFVDGNGAPREVRYTDGTLVVIAVPRVPLNAAGYADFTVVPNDDASVHVDDRGFGVQVGWDLQYRADNAQWVPLKSAGRTVVVTSASPSVAQFGLLATATPVIVGTSYITQGTADANYSKKDGLFNVRSYGTVADGVTNDGPAINSAIAACVAAGGGVVYIPRGTYKIGTTLNLSNIHPSAFHYNSDPGVTLRGDGRHATVLTGGEASYGMIEMVGSNRITIEGMSLQPTGTVQYGILSGRTTGDGSSGEHVFRDITIYGAFTVAGIFAMSSECCTYERMFVYSTAGNTMILARDLTGFTGVSAKYTPLSATATIAGGNGLNRMHQVSLLNISTTSTDSPLILEYVQDFTADNLYIISINSARQIEMRKLCMGATFIGLQQEWSTNRPLGFYFSAANVSPSSPDYRGVHIKASRALSIYAEDNVRLAEFEFVGTEWRGADTWQMDVYTLYDSTVKFDSRATSTATVVTNPQYRVRSISRSNDWGPVDTAPLTAPVITLGTTSGSGGTFAANTYYWVLTATNVYGQTIASNQVTAAISANGTQVINWSAVTGATGYKLYRSTTSGVYTGSARVALLGAVTTYTDTGTALAAEAPPAIATAGRPSAVFRGVGARMFDTFLGKPIWSTGAAWVDATGTVV